MKPQQLDCISKHGGIFVIFAHARLKHTGVLLSSHASFHIYFDALWHFEARPANILMIACQPNLVPRTSRHRQMNHDG